MAHISRNYLHRYALHPALRHSGRGWCSAVGSGARFHQKFAFSMIVVRMHQFRDLHLPSSGLEIMGTLGLGFIIGVLNNDKLLYFSKIIFLNERKRQIPTVANERIGTGLILSYVSEDIDMATAH